MHRHGCPLNFRFVPLFPLACVLLSSAATAQTPALDARFWGSGAEPLSADFAAVEVTRADQPIQSAASNDSPRRGSALLGARLPLFGAELGAGCHGRWFLVGPDAYICEDGATATKSAPLALDARGVLSADGLPYRYYFVSRDGAFGYDALETAEDGVPATQLEPGFGVALTRVGQRSSNDAFGLTTHGFWVPLRDLAPAAPIAFHGSGWSTTLAWVTRDAAPLFSAPGKRKRGESLERLTLVSVLEEKTSGALRYARVSENAWLDERDITRPMLATPPAEARPGERWLDIDLGRQTLVAYAGETPQFATLISSGRGASGSETATPPGTHRIWVKLKTSDMDNLENADARENYAIEAVPWVMFFQRGYGLHGTFWHHRFGEVKSHGCVNLAPIDAEQLFYWTSPRLLPGWTAVLPTPHEPGTLIQIH